jgi:uncharacterized protein (DUF697 family)
MKADASWTLVPGSEAEVEELIERCKKMVRRRAVISAGAAAVPLPGVDLLSDVGLFTLLIEDINRAFGLTEQQIGRLQPTLRVVAYEAATAAGGMMVGKLVTRELVVTLFKKTGLKLFAKSAARVVPLAGQVAAAAIGFTVFRRLGEQHVAACAAVARELLAAGR